MYITVDLVADNRFSYLIDTEKLDEDFKHQVESELKTDCYGTFEGDYAFMEIQKGIVTDKSVFPVTIHGMLTVYLD